MIYGTLSRKNPEHLHRYKNMLILSHMLQIHALLVMGWYNVKETPPDILYKNSSIHTQMWGRAQRVTTLKNWLLANCKN